MFRRAEKEQPYLSKSDFKTLAETARKVFLSSHPNPERKGCPDPRLLRNLAFRKVPTEALDLSLHLGECSNCFREFTAYSEQYKESRRRIWLGLGAVAAVVLVGAIGWLLAMRSFHKPVPEVGKTVTTPEQKKILPPARERNDQSSSSVIAKVETPLPVVDYTAPSYSRGAEPISGSVAKTLVLERKKVTLRIHLPIGSAPGMYEIRFHRKLDNEQVLKFDREASKDNHQPTLTIENDFSKLPAGAYLLAIFPPGFEGEINAFPVKVTESNPAGQ